MARIAVIGDVGGHAEQLRQALRELGCETEPPAGLVVIQVGDLVDRGPDSMEVLGIVAPLIGRSWVQLAGNHEAQYLAGQKVFWPDPLPQEGVETLRAWWATGGCRSPRPSPPAERSSS